ncbi:VanZ family protein [Propionivibrio sp.]|uniref:VanZ family protein n=1 Tax=Propionivibrio sp. TaxID=2212460 RepID=UPI003BF1A553
MPSPKPAAGSAAINKIAPLRTLLPRYLALAYAVLIVYASLYPFTGWRDAGLSPIAFLDAAWPRYWTVFDLLINVVAYLPLGFLLALTLRRLPGRWTPAFTALLLGALISFCLESVQTWLPSRVPSNLDLACNTLGAGIGALLTIWHGERFFLRVAQMQQRLLAPIPHAELGLVLIGLWLLTQLSPETILFGAGDLRHLLEITPAVPYAAHSFFALETGIIVCNTIAIGLIVRALLADHYPPWLALTAFFFFALLIRTLAAAVLVDPLNAFAWLTPGAAYGMLAGGVLLSIILLLPVPLRIALAGLVLMAGTVLVNLTPPNPYSAAALATWQQGHFFNFNGVTRLAASLWPFLALPYLTMLGRRS